MSAQDIGWQDHIGMPDMTAATSRHKYRTLGFRMMACLLILGGGVALTASLVQVEPQIAGLTDRLRNTIAGPSVQDPAIFEPDGSGLDDIAPAAGPTPPSASASPVHPPHAMSAEERIIWEFEQQLNGELELEPAEMLDPLAIEAE